jgi:predicted nucleic acid-binding Zn ribbon protein
MKDPHCKSSVLPRDSQLCKNDCMEILIKDQTETTYWEILLKVSNKKFNLSQVICFHIN